MSRAAYLRQWRVDKDPDYWLWKPRKRAVCAVIFGIRVKVNLASGIKEKENDKSSPSENSQVIHH
jgi:hypothetical protein